MGRHATIIGQAEDIWGRVWDVREARPTEHGWPVMLGWPQDAQRGKGGGGVRAIMTRDLADYLESMRMDPDGISLPLCRTAIKRLRKALGHDWHADNAAWWRERCVDTTSTIEDFRAAHGRSAGAVSQHRRRPEHVRRYDADGCRLLITAEAAQIIGLTPATLSSAIKAGDLRSCRLEGRPWIRIDDLFLWRESVNRRFRADTRYIPDDISEWITIDVASRLTGIPEYAILYRMHTNWLMSIMRDRRRLVHPDDVRAIPYTPRPNSRGKSSPAHQRGGWTADQIALLGTDTDRAIGLILGRTPESIERYRNRLRIPAYIRRRPHNDWTAEEDALLGTDTDSAIGLILGRTPISIQRRRTRLRIPAYTPSQRTR
jgi:hypothetical protein